MAHKIGYDLSCAVIDVVQRIRFIAVKLRGGNARVVRILVIKNRKIVLVRHTAAPFVWTLPGGGVEDSEDIASAAIREVREECGLNIGTMSEVASYKGPMGEGDVAFVLVAGDIEGSLSSSKNLEIFERHWFDLGDLPENILQVHEQIIRAYRNGAL